MDNPNVSVVIVCMNNYEQLKDCLNSIIKFTHKVTYEILVVAYFFSEENINRLNDEFPNVNVIISDQIRGFSANNNLALRKAKGEYCFIVNDDTFMEMPVIDELYSDAINDDNITIISPQILRKDGSVQYSGMPPCNWKTWLLTLFKLKILLKSRTDEWVKYNGIFQTYNILGAAFLIKTKIFRDFGWFNEYYFYGPEDRALSTTLNKNGYKCFVDTSVKITHLVGGSGGTKTKTLRATRPAHRKGVVHFFSQEKKSIAIVLKCCIFINSIYMILVWFVKMMCGDKDAVNSCVANINVCKTIFNGQTPTEIFKRFYKR